jgi:hypothetical protein
VLAIVVSVGAGVGGFDVIQAVPGLLVAHYLLYALAVFLLMPLMIGFLSSAYRQIVSSRTRP